MPPYFPPRYFRATVLTALAVAMLPVNVLVFGYLDYQSPNWDPVGDSGAAQGFMVLFLATLLAVCYVATAFPAAARRLHRLQKLSAGSFVKVLSVWLIVASALLSTVASLLVGGLWLVVPLTLILFSLGALLVLPFCPFWLWLAK